MNKIAYTYCIVKYVHDPAAGEMLNIGVLLCAPSESYFAAKFDYHYERLTNAFAGFNGENYRYILHELETAMWRLKENLSPTLFVLQEPINNAEQLSRQIMPDRGLSIQFGTLLAGLTIDLESELEYIFQEMVLARYLRKERKSRNDEEVWAVYQKPLHEKHLIKYLKPKTFVSESYDLRFDHAFKNEKWHVLKPVTMDYANAQTIQERAIKVLGEAASLEGNSELSKMYILLGEPKEKLHRLAFDRARNLLNKIPIPKELVEENEAKDFAKELADYMREHGVIDNQNANNDYSEN